MGRFHPHRRFSPLARSRGKIPAPTSDKQPSARTQRHSLNYLICKFRFRRRFDDVVVGNKKKMYISDSIIFPHTSTHDRTTARPHVPFRTTLLHARAHTQRKNHAVDRRGATYERRRLESFIIFCGASKIYARRRRRPSQSVGSRIRGITTLVVVRVGYLARGENPRPGWERCGASVCAKVLRGNADQLGRLENVGVLHPGGTNPKVRA